jgi:hypothetical protein
VSFGYQGTSYEIDLSNKNLAAIDKTLSCYRGRAQGDDSSSTGDARPRRDFIEGRSGCDPGMGQANGHMV